MQNKILSALNWRYATKKFDTTKKVPQETLDTLLEVIRLAPSSSGIQPWKFLVVTNPKIRKELQAAGYGQPQIAEASHLLVFTHRTDVDEAYADKVVENTAEARDKKTSELEGLKGLLMGGIGREKDELNHWLAKQCYIPLGMLLESAALLEIDACPMEGFDKQKFDEILGLKEKNLTSVVICALGYRSKDDSYAKEAKARFSHEEVVEWIK